MPRPKEGYRNAAGQSIPGTSDITKRFMNRDRLLYWAFNRGKQGHAKLYDEAALDIGTTVHMMAELDLGGKPEADITFYLDASLRDEESREKARHAFAAYRKWRDEFHVEAITQEVSLISETLQYGGTLDNVARIRKGRGLVDFKTSASGEVYVDMVLQLAGYAILWDENHPDQPLDEGYHLIVLPKDGSKPVHREFTEAQLHPYRQQFWLYRKAYDFDQICDNPKVLKGGFVKPSRKPRTEAVAPKERITIKAPDVSRGMSWGELLRAYGHVQPNEGVPA